MQVLIIGGTGTLGRQIAKKAIDSSYQVRCMVRRPRNASFLQEWGCELTQGDLLNPEDLKYSLEGIDAVNSGSIKSTRSTIDLYRRLFSLLPTAITTS